jgi:hypothetical protein
MLIAAAAVYGSSSTAPLRAIEPAAVRVTPANQSAAVGANVSVQVTVASVSDPEGLGAYEFALIWNPAALTYVSAQNGAFLGSTGREVSCLPLRFDADDDGVDDPGFLRMGCVTFAAQPAGPLDGGLLATVNFTTKCAAAASLEFDTGRTILSDPLANDIPVTAENGTITITGAPPCPIQPTPTVTRTFTPARTITRTPSRTPTRTRTPTPGNSSAGDVDCNGRVTAVDAALILQLDAGIIRALRCPANGDVSDDGSTNSIDALFILQFVAGRLPAL